MARPLELPAWPGGADVAVCLTFDVDTDAPWPVQSPASVRRLSTRSEGRFGAVRGVPRILELLARHDAKATFYVPGSTAELYPDCVRALVAAGHEVGHHGHHHLRSEELDADAQRTELEQGLAALERVADVRPRGYRSPAWELTPETFELLLEHGFAYDSSCMGDDRPYLEEAGGRTLLELPVHWSLDDVPYFHWGVEMRGTLASPSAWLECWLAEFDSAHAERRLVTYTMHPEVIGRAYRFAALERLIDALAADGRTWFATHSEVAARCERTYA
jgi:peptidoglycan-N-acetylglucosamine deacetylase